MKKLLTLILFTVALSAFSQPSITVTYPNGGENLVAGQSSILTWNSNNVAQVNIEAYNSISFNWISIANNIANIGSYVLAVPNVPGSQAKIRVTDAANATVTDESDALFNIVSAGALVVDSVKVNDVVCRGEIGGTITIYASGGIQPYLYNIDTGATFFTNGGIFNFVVAGNYTIQVMDNIGNTASVNVTVSQPASAIQLTLISQTTHGAPDTVAVSPTGGTPPYIIGWQNATNEFVPSGDTVTNVYYSNSIYHIAAYDSVGCLAELTFNNTNLPNDCTIDTISLSTTDTICYVPGIVDSVSVLTAPLHGLLSSAAFTCIVYTPVTNYTGDDYFEMVVHMLGGGTDTLRYCYYIKDPCIGCVWPGDANYNGIADNNDLLVIGLGYGITGTARSQQDINWYGHPAVDWADTLTTGTNYKHIDCDGNGTINSNDTIAIIQNFGLTHAKNNESAPWRAAAPALYVQLAPDTTQAGDTMYANLILGDAIIPAANVYGLAFTLNYDAAVVDSNRTRATFGNSWLGTSTDKISIAKDLKATGELKCAITRIDHTMRSGNGQIGQVSFVITTDNINGKNLAYYNMHVWLSDVTMIDNQGNVLDINEGQDSSQVEFEPLSVGSLQLEVGSVKMQPNPASYEFCIYSSQSTINQIQLVDLSGRIISKYSLPDTKRATMDVANLANGIYLVQISSGKSTVTKRLVIAR